MGSTPIGDGDRPPVVQLVEQPSKTSSNFLILYGRIEMLDTK